MRIVIQRVSEAAVSVAGDVVGRCEQGLLVLVGVGHNSEISDAVWLADKTADLRVFRDTEDRMNLSLRDIGGGVLAVSQFTLYGDARKGRRPSFRGAAEPTSALALFEAYCEAVERHGVAVGRGVFGAEMKIAAVLDGPVTISVDSEGR